MNKSPFFSLSLGIARVAMKDETQVRRLMEEILRLKYFNGEDWRVTPTEVIRDIWRKVMEISGEIDLLKEIKNKQNSIEHLRANKIPT